MKGIRKAIQQRWGQIIPGKNGLSSADEQALSGTFLNEPSFQKTKRNSRWISRRKLLVGGIIGLCTIGTGVTMAYKETHSVPTTLITYKGHTKAVWRVAWSPDKDYSRIASGGDDETIQVWEVNTQKLLYVYPGDKHIIWDVSWSPDGTRLAAASWNKTVPVWDAATGHIIAIYRGHTDTVRSVAWSPDSTRIASASRDLDVHIWEANTARLIATYQPHQTDTIMSVAWSLNGIYIASAGWDKTVRVWEAETGKNLINYTGHANTVLDIDWSPDSTSIASASMDSTAHVWESLTGKQICIYRDHKESVYSVKWSPDGSYLASGSGDNTVKVGTCTATASGWDCSVTLSTSATTANWSVASPDLPQDAITYNPLSGVLSADNQYKQTIIISITSAVCQNNTSGSFVFSFPQANMSPVTIPWSCS